MSLPTLTRAQRRQLERDNAKQPQALQLVPSGQWPRFATGARIPFAVWRCRRFLVQGFTAPYPACYRLTISRTDPPGKDGRWLDGIAWEDMQEIKRQCGFGELDAVEVFPADADVVNVANMRHLWIIKDPLPFAWRHD